MCKIEINGVSITLTSEQLKEINKQQNKLSLIDRINTIEDIYKELGIKEGDFLPYKNPKTKQEKSLNALAKIYKITEYYNNGDIIDFKNSNTRKYYLYNYISCGSLLVEVSFYYSDPAGHSVGYFFSKEENAKDALKKFKDIFEEYWMI